MKNPLVEEGQDVYIASPQYLRLHGVYIAVVVLFAAMMWPGQSYMAYFRSGTIPAAFQAMVVFQLITVAGLSMYAGLDRLAESRLIKYSEWLERTTIPISTLFWGKLLTGTIHTVFLVALSVPAVVISAGPAGITSQAILASEAVVLLTGLVCRSAGLLISHVGEFRYVIRVVGGWIFLALLFVVTLQVLPSANPIIAAVQQHAEESPLMRPDLPSTIADNPLVLPATLLSFLVVTLLALFALSLIRHRRKGAVHGANGETGVIR